MNMCNYKSLANSAIMNIHNVYCDDMLCMKLEWIYTWIQQFIYRNIHAYYIMNVHACIDHAFVIWARTHTNFLNAVVLGHMHIFHSHNTGWSHYAKVYEPNSRLQCDLSGVCIMFARSDITLLQRILIWLTQWCGIISVCGVTKLVKVQKMYNMIISDYSPTSVIWPRQFGWKCEFCSWKHSKSSVGLYTCNYKASSLCYCI